jgi:hypothetical protein
MAELRANIHKRGYIKAQLTRFQNFITHYSAENYLEFRLEKITPILHEYEQVQFQIELAEPDNEEHSDERDTFELNYFRLVAEAKRLITESPLNASSSDNSNNNVNTNNIPRYQQTNVQTYMQLPTLNLIHFDGKYENWGEFYDSFCAFCVFIIFELHSKVMLYKLFNQ